MQDHHKMHFLALVVSTLDLTQVKTSLNYSRFSFFKFMLYMWYTIEDLLQQFINRITDQAGDPLLERANGERDKMEKFISKIPTVFSSFHWQN
jgi:hypothetical protein